MFNYKIRLHFNRMHIITLLPVSVFPLLDVCTQHCVTIPCYRSFVLHILERKFYVIMATYVRNVQIFQNNRR